MSTATADDNSVRAKGKAASEIDNIIADVEDLLMRVTQASDPDFEKLREKLEEKIDLAKQMLGENGKQMADSARNAAKVTDNYVRENPWQAIGIAAVIGAVIGYALSRR